MLENLKVYFSEDEIKKRVKELADEISRDYEGKKPILIGILKGSFIFLSDLCRELTIPHEIDFLGVSSYGESTSTTGVVKITQDLSNPIVNKDVLIVEDIVDTGLTMDYLLKNFSTRKPASIKVCTLLYKPARMIVKPPIDYIGFTIENRFVIGYGLDYENYYRNLKYIGYLDKKPSSKSK